MIQVRRLGHATLTTPDLDRAIEYYVEIVGLTLSARERGRAVLASRQGLEAIVRFYADVLGFRVSDWRDDSFAFLRCGPDHHSINFVTDPTPQLHHIAF